MVLLSELSGLRVSFREIILADNRFNNKRLIKMDCIIFQSATISTFIDGVFYFYLILHLYYKQKNFSYSDRM